MEYALPRFGVPMDVITVPTDVWSLAGRLALATLLGTILGANREFAGKPAGLRTHALVSLGAALATLTGLLMAQTPGDDSAPSRIVQGILAGIGFLGGGVILRGREGREVHGLTTAASIWIVSVTGAAAGSGLWRSAVIVVGLSLAVLTLGRPLDNLVRGTDINSPDHD